MDYRHTRVMGANHFQHSIRALATGPDGRLYSAGDSQVTVFDPAGKVVRQWPTAKPACAIALAPGNRVFVGQAGQIEIFQPDGQLIKTWRAGWLGELTAIGFHQQDTFVADAAARCIHRYNQDLQPLNDIGKDNRTNGFLIPNGILDFQIDAHGILHAANPGKHRIERYQPDGKLLGHIGRFDGIDPEGFPGCCNPTNLALGPNGLVLVTEKAGPRAKALTASGKLAAVLASSILDPNCKNMPVAADFRGRVYVAETVKRHILVFEQVEAR